MSRFWLGSFLVLFSCLAPEIGGVARAEEHSGHPAKAAKLEATLHKDGKEVEKEFDPSSNKDMQELNELLKAGEVEHLKAIKEVNPVMPKWEIGIWTIVVFVLLCIILQRAAWGPMLEGLQKREQNILAAVEDAKKAREESQKLRETLQQEMDKAQEKVAAILEEARRDAKLVADDLAAKARAEIQTERDRLHREIRTATDQALQQLWNSTANLAMDLSAKALRKQTMPDDHRRLVDEALAELSQSGDDWRKQMASVRV